MSVKKTTKIFTGFLLMMLLLFSCQEELNTSINVDRNLRTKFSSKQLNTITRLIIQGTIDAQDIRFMRDSMPQLSYLDMSNVIIAEYKGDKGTMMYQPTNYPQNEIPISAFSIYGKGKKTLKNVILPYSITSIGELAFMGCENLDSIIIPNMVTSIGNLVFGYCFNLQHAKILSSLENISECSFKYCLNLREINIPNSVKTIKSNAFEYCVRLTDIEIPNSVVEISDNAFIHCTALNTLKIPHSLRWIGSNAFDHCNNLNSIYSYAITPANTASENIFSDSIKSTCILYVPTTSLNAYISATHWKDFSNIVGM